MIKFTKIYSLLFFILFLLLYLLSLLFLLNQDCLMLELELMMLNSSMVLYTILLDWMSLLFMSFVMFISSMVIFYSEEYMFGDLNINRFIMLVVLFVMSMMFLIISPNLISILLGWDGLGLVSYCLVIYYQNIKSFNAGMLTALINRMGDVALLISISWMVNFGSWNFIYYLEFMKKDDIMKMIIFMVLFAAFTKSAQIPFSSWLPAAMAAPTPVSSLVHSSTLVTAGVYLLIRFNFSFNYLVIYIGVFLSSLTMFMAGLGANFEFDLKKIIALSTLSQLGLMMSILFLGGYKLAFFHLLIHALFKALLFMCAGNFIHNLMNCQDIRFMGNLFQFMPLSSMFFNISNLSLCGLPFLSGFYSKDLILETLSMQYINLFIYLMFYISVGLTVSYSFRLMYYFMVSHFNFLSLNYLEEISFKMLLSMGGLCIFVLFSGSLMMWLIFIIPSFIYLTFFMKIFTLLIILSGMILGLLISNLSFNEANKSLLYKISFFFSSMWNMSFLSVYMFNKNLFLLSESYYFNIDQGWFEFYGGQGGFNNLIKISNFFLILFIGNFFVILFLLMIYLLLSL
uniref:NADH-ubiquinone oxidoreductase chain 5 n=1 Tax=Ptiliidae sp. BMNH 1274723 TaxID=1796536 RepID=A0A126TEE5_9COLE|nr:NADH dehydrogenase subunit 5 [Ptiliidae sp. BMNH 1274723]